MSEINFEALKNDVLHYWFGSAFEDGFCVENKAPIWFTGGEAIDKEIKERFLPVLEQVEKLGPLLDAESIINDSELALAIVVLLDQFSRNIYRGSEKAFGNDPQALSLAKQLVVSGAWKSLQTVQRVFVLMPYEHSEDIADQNKCVQLMEALLDEVPETQKGKVAGYIEHAVQHRDIIERFGRFPHRNPVLDRISTEEELKYLEETGNYFGQK